MIYFLGHGIIHERFLYLLLMGGVLLASCCRSEHAKTERMADYTVIVYATGGGNLDHSLEDHIAQSCLGAGDDVQFVWQLKYSGSECPVRDGGVVGKPGATYRFVAKKGVLADYDRYLFKDSKDSATFMMDEPENIADFIRYATKEAPAKQYILLILDHCRGYAPMYDRTEARGLFRDLITGRSLTIGNLSAGIEEAGTSFACIYFDACLSNSIEYAVALRNDAHYFLSSSHSIAGGSYSALAESLRRSESIEDALKDYAAAVTDFWDKKAATDVEAMDISLTDLSQLDHVLAPIQQFSESLGRLQHESDEQDRAKIKDIMNAVSAAAYRPDADECYRDINDYVSRLAYMLEIAMLEGSLKRSDVIAEMMQAADGLRRGIVSAQPFHLRTAPLVLSGRQLSWNVCVPAPGEWTPADKRQYESNDFARYGKFTKYAYE